MTLKQTVDESLILPNYKAKNRSSEWVDDLKSAKLIKADIPPRDNKLYLAYNRYYLTTIDDEYLGHIKFDITSIDGYACLMIGETNSKNSIYNVIGFYKIMFHHILTFTSVDIIFNDIQESIQSINSWKRLKGTRLNFVVLDQIENKIISYSDQEHNKYWTTILNDWDRYRVGVTETKLSLQESYNNISSSELHRCTIRNETYEYRKKFRDEEYNRMEEIRFLGLDPTDYKD